MRTLLSRIGRFSLSIILIGSALAACAPAATPPPATQDPATLVAAAVKTLSAQITAEAAAHPSATPTLPPTQTPVPTNTPVPPTDTPGVPTATATATDTPAPALSAQALYTTTYPDNKREYTPNVKFGLALGFKNTGSITWDPGTTIKLVSFKGEATVQLEAQLGKNVAPGDKAEYNLWAFGSETLGQHIWYFQMYNGQGVPIPGGSISFYYTSK